MNSDSLKDNKFLAKIWEKQCSLSFCVAVILLYLIMAYSQVLGGKYAFLSGDSLEIYVPAIRQFARSIFSGGNIFYSWTNSLGMNTSAYYASYAQIFSVPSIVYYLFPQMDINIASVIAVSIKVGLSAMTFDYLLRKRFNSSCFVALLFSEMYALSSFQISMNLINFIWMDAMYILPILVYLIIGLHKGEKGLLIPVVYAYLFVTNFYMGYMVGLFSFMVVLVLLIFGKDSTNKVRVLVRFFLYASMGAGLAAVLLLPAAYFIMYNGALDATSQYDSTFSLLETYNQFFIVKGNSAENTAPYVYCGLISIFCLPIFIVERKIESNDKKVYGSLLLFLLVSCLLYPLFLMWHAFDVPDGWNFRFSFLLSFVICIIGCVTCTKTSILRNKKIVYVILINIVFYIFYNLYKHWYKGFSNRYFWFIFLANLILMVLYLFIGIMYSRNENVKKNAKVIIAFLVSVELIINGFVQLNQDARSSMLASEHTRCIAGMYDNVIQLEQDELYRVNIEDDFMINSDTFWGINGLADFTTTENYYVRLVFEKLGAYTSTRVVRAYNDNDFIKMITGVKYDILSSDYQRYYGDENNQYTTKLFPYYLGMGFCVDRKMKDFSLRDLSENNTFDNCNRLASEMINSDVMIYEFADSEGVNFIQDSIHFVVDDGEVLLVADENAEGAKYLLITVPIDERQAYIQFDSGASLETSGSPILKDGIENMRDTKGRITASYMKEMNRYADCFETSVVMTDNTVQRWPMPNMYIAYYNEDEMQRLYDSLKDGAMNVTEYNDGYVKANIEIKDDSQMLFTSIPYDEGWTIYANGTEVQPVELLDGAFIGLDLGKGEYELEFKYEAPGARLGLVISLVSLGIYGILVLLFFVNIKRKKEK